MYNNTHRQILYIERFFVFVVNKNNSAQIISIYMYHLGGEI